MMLIHNWESPHSGWGWGKQFRVARWLTGLHMCAMTLCIYCTGVSDALNAPAPQGSNPSPAPLNWCHLRLTVRSGSTPANSLKDILSRGGQRRPNCNTLTYKKGRSKNANDDLFIHEAPQNPTVQSRKCLSTGWITHSSMGMIKIGPLHVKSFNLERNWAKTEAQAKMAFQHQS